MGFLTVLSVYFLTNSVSAASDDSKVFRKCCPLNQTLLKVFNSNLVSTENYKCNDSDRIVQYSNLLVDPEVIIDDSIPKHCELQEVPLKNMDSKLMVGQDICYDRLVTEIDGTIDRYTGISDVALKCNETELMSRTELEIQYVAKCCPTGQAYDMELRLCRESNKDSIEEWIERQLQVKDAKIYEFEYEPYCAADEYAVELLEGTFMFALNGSGLSVKTKGGSSKLLRKGFWCVDQVYNTGMMMARICTVNCSAYGAFCMRKCCDLGQHFRRCGTKLYCNRSTSTNVPFNISSYIEPLMLRYEDVMGFRQSLLECPDGFVPYILDSSVETERHILSKDGRLIIGSTSTEDDYCLETFNTCSEKMYVTVMHCRLMTKKNYSMSFVLICISVVCLALSLVVYCSVPGLRNQHGLMLMSYVSTLLLAYSCMARAQYGRIDSVLFCTMVGYGMYFGFVSAFVWLNVMSIDIWWTMSHTRAVSNRQSGAIGKKFKRYSLWAWGVSLTLTLVTGLLDKYSPIPVLDANIGVGYCWFGSATNTRNDWPRYVLFVMPMGLINCVNFVLWVLTVIHCVRVKSAVAKMHDGLESDDAKRRLTFNTAHLMLTGKLGVLMGANWSMELISTLLTNPDGTVPWFIYIMDIINELQGFWILIFLAFKPKTFYDYMKNKVGLAVLKIRKNENSATSRDTSMTTIPSNPDISSSMKQE